MHFAKQRPIKRIIPLKPSMQRITSLHWEYLAVLEDEGGSAQRTESDCGLVEAS